MNILVIKQTSLGDVLHSTGHVRAIKRQYPDARLTLLTATTSMDLYRYNPWVDEFITFDRYRIKREWWRHPVRSLGHIRETIRQVRERHYDLAIDLQGLAKSTLFLYAADADRKFVKGNWPGLKGYRNRDQHAISEMDGVLRAAGIESGDTRMEIGVGEAEQREVEAFLIERGIGPTDQIVIMSPFSRRESKDWPLSHYRQLIELMPDDVWVLVTGSADRQEDVNALVEVCVRPRTLALAGELTLLQFTELIGRSRVLVSGDSFPMHLAAAAGIPVVSLFGPTDEERVGPQGTSEAVVLRSPDCRRCDSRKGCQFSCLADISAQRVHAAAAAFLDA